MISIDSNSAIILQQQQGNTNVSTAVKGLIAFIKLVQVTVNLWHSQYQETEITVLILKHLSKGFEKRSWFRQTCTELKRDSLHIRDPESKSSSNSKMFFKVENNQHLV